MRFSDLTQTYEIERNYKMTDQLSILKKLSAILLTSTLFITSPYASGDESADEEKKNHCKNSMIQDQTQDNNDNINWLNNPLYQTKGRKTYFLLIKKFSM